MAQTLNKLSARSVASITEPGRHSDGGNLYLCVDKPKSGQTVGAKRWVFLYRDEEGKRREMGLGGVTSVTLAKARELAAAARAQLQAGIDPIAARDAADVTIPTFGEEADAYIEAMTPQFRNDKHIAQWKMTLDVYAKSLRSKRVNKITTADVLEVLSPIWTELPETASRLRGRIERVLNSSKAKGHRTGENPAAWRGHLDNLLPRRQKLSRGHHAALPYADVPAFIAKLRERRANAARALEFTILTAARSGEVYGLKWREIDEKGAVWTVPKDRMKAFREHRVPLCARAIAILKEMKEFGVQPEAYVFPSADGKALSNLAMTMLLRRMKMTVTVHGFRSSFRDWCGEVSTFPRELAEAALAHVVGDETERAYRRGDALAKRRKLMDAWANYCERSNNVVQLRPNKQAKQA